MKRFSLLWLLLIGSFALVWCENSVLDVSQSEYPVIDQTTNNSWVTINNNTWEVFDNNTWETIENNTWETIINDESSSCKLWTRRINMDDEENTEWDSEETEITPLTIDDLDRITKDHFPKYYTFSNFNAVEDLVWDSGKVTYPNDSDSLLIPEYATMVSKQIVDSGFDEGMYYTHVKITLQDGSIIKVLYIVNSETLEFVAATVENWDNTTNYQFYY